MMTIRSVNSVRNGHKGGEYGEINVAEVRVNFKFERKLMV